MSKAKKLMAKLMLGQADKSFSFADAALILAHQGFTLDFVTGSHHTFRHADGRRVTLPKHGKDIKPHYAKTIRETLT
ncbi:MAG: type II toxin-antitoxin system HicA family toxin [Verrucomicrobiales bacterium]|nr:type II toxin-antitoxin system HicA family toxin [Verrucomicrobiales bacterium]